MEFQAKAFFPEKPAVVPAFILTYNRDAFLFDINQHPGTWVRRKTMDLINPHQWHLLGIVQMVYPSLRAQTWGPERAGRV